MKRLHLPVMFAWMLLGLLTACTSPPRPPYDLRFQSALDRRPIAKPEATRISKHWERAYNEFFRFIYNFGDLPYVARGTGESLGVRRRAEALDVNAWDEVPDSSWFTNRIGRPDWSVEKTRLGPRTSGPDLENPWIVISGKTDGVTPGFTIRDSRGDIYFIKFDPSGYAEMPSGAEVISSLILHSTGYNVPAYYPVDVPLSLFRLGPGAETRGEYKNTTREMTQEDLDRILQAAPTDRLGRARVSAGLALPGEPLGPFLFEGRRSDDLNDRIDHEHRRVLRAYYIISSWINNTDVKASNTLDTFITRDRDGKGGGHGFVRHHMIDFGSTLGSAGYGPKDSRDGFEFFLDYGEMAKSFVRLGTYDPYWLGTRVSIFSSAGLFEARLFDPLKWRPSFPSAAYYEITPRDAFWAAKLILKFTDDHLRAVVGEARYGEPLAAQYVLNTLIVRRNKIGRVWLTKMTPLDEFAVRTDGRRLVIEAVDLGVSSGLFAPDSRRYLLAGDFGTGFDRSSVQASTRKTGEVAFRFDRTPGKKTESYKILLKIEDRDPRTGAIVPVGEGVAVQTVCADTGCVITGIDRKY